MIRTFGKERNWESTGEADTCGCPAGRVACPGDSGSLTREAGRYPDGPYDNGEGNSACVEEKDGCREKDMACGEETWRRHEKDCGCREEACDRHEKDCGKGTCVTHEKDCGCGKETCKRHEENCGCGEETCIRDEKDCGCGKETCKRHANDCGLPGGCCGSRVSESDCGHITCRNRSGCGCEDTGQHQCQGGQNQTEGDLSETQGEQSLVSAPSISTPVTVNGVNLHVTVDCAKEGKCGGCCCADPCRQAVCRFLRLIRLLQLSVREEEEAVIEFYGVTRREFPVLGILEGIIRECLFAIRPAARVFSFPRKNWN